MTILNAFRTQHFNVTIGDLFLNHLEGLVSVFQHQPEVPPIINH